MSGGRALGAGLASVAAHLVSVAHCRYGRVLMGVPFLIGLSLLQGEAEGWVAWAWGMNGVGSVMASLVNLIITVTFGLRAALLAAAVIYCLALLMFRSWASSRALAQAC